MTRFRKVTRQAVALAGSDSILILYLCLIAAWLADFQAQEAGAGLAIQAMFLAAFATFGLLFFLADRGAAFRIPGLTPLLVTGALYLLVAVICALARGQMAYAIARNAIPVVIYLGAAYATARVVLQVDPQALRLWLGRFCLAFLVAGFIIGLAFSGRTLDSIRYQIIGASITPALALLGASMLFRISIVEWAAFFFSLFVTFLSVTRTYVIVVLVQLLPLLRHPRVIFSGRFSAFIFVAILAGAVIFQFGDFGVGRWTDRLISRSVDRGIDPTTYARLSEWAFMYNAWTGSIAQFLFGNGLAAMTEYYVPSGNDEWVEGSLGFGHNQYLSLVFTGGLIGGVPLILIQLRQIWRSTLLLSRVAARGSKGRWDILMLTAWGALMVLGYLVTNSLTSTFVNRGFSLWFGIGTGLLLGGQAWFLPENQAMLSQVSKRSNAAQ